MRRVVILVLLGSLIPWMAASLAHAGEGLGKPPTSAVGQSSKLFSLAGTWSCRLDPGRRGITEGWKDGTVEEHRVAPPGTSHTNGIGQQYDTKLISSLTPISNQLGPVWYWRDIELSESDCEQLVELSLKRVCWESFDWLNGKPLGTRNSLVAPHDYDLNSRQAARQLRQSLLDYVVSAAFRPLVAIDPGDIDELIEAHREEPVVLTRDELKARFDQAVVRETSSSQQERSAQ